MVSKASEDLPEPERPVKTTSLSRGISTSMFFRLCSRAPNGDDAERAGTLLASRFQDFIHIGNSRRTERASKKGRASLLQPRSDANRGDARNVGRTAGEFPCRARIITQ